VIFSRFFSDSPITINIMQMESNFFDSGRTIGEVGWLMYHLETVADLDCGFFYLPQDFQAEFPVMHTPLGGDLWLIDLDGGEIYLSHRLLHYRPEN